MTNKPTLALAAIAAALLQTGSAAAQCTPGGPPSPRAQRGALVGIVMDSAHRAIDGAEVVIGQALRRTRTGADGRFVLGNLSPGTYEVSVRRIGYEMAVQDYQVADSGGVARFCLEAGVLRLVPVISTATRLGLSGVVGDSLFKPLPGAEVRVFAGGAPIVTDSAGGFHAALKPGTYALLVSKDGYGRQLLSVTVPKDSGRDIAVWLGPIPRNPHRMFAAYDDMRIRLQQANANRSALVSAEDLTRTYDLFFAAQAAIREKLPPDHCEAYIDGGPYMLPLTAIPKEDVATMEMYLNKAPRSGPTSINGRGSGGGKVLSTASQPRPTCGAALIYVWLK